jgi:hypothetical protein
MMIPPVCRRRFLASLPAGLAAAGLVRRAGAADPEPIRPADPNGFLGRRSPVFTRRCLASSSSPLVTQVGLRVLEDGGNAFDAAQLVRIHRGEAGAGPCLEAGVDHRLDGVALGW